MMTHFLIFHCRNENQKYKYKCCKGYYKKKNKCYPFCSQKCENSVCVAPNVCGCHEGYKKLTTFK